jgi:small nuclear ribonucleoprotein B and B'
VTFGFICGFVAMSMSLKKAKMADLIDYRLRIVMLDGRQLVGQLLAFDKFMNVVLSDTEEFRIPRNKDSAEIKRTLGLVILRGETIVSVSVEAPPSSDESSRLGGLQPGPGIAKAISRTGAGFGGSALLSGPIRTNAPQGFQPPSGFQPPPGFGGR